MTREIAAVLLLAATVTTVGAASASASEPPADSDPWKGRLASELLKLLGEPDKRREAKDGSEKLTYRLLRVEDGDLTDPGLTLLEVPGVGLVGRRLVTADPKGATIVVEPTIVDEQGRPTGGVTSTESRSVSWSKKEGLVVPDEPDRAPRRKLGLTFHVDPAGRIVEWEADPKLRPRRPE